MSAATGLSRSIPWQIARAYLGFARQTFKEGLAYRGNVWGFLLMEMLSLFVMVAVWKSLYAGAGMTEVAGINLETMVTYILLADILGMFAHFNELGEIDSRLRKGDIALDLLRPANYFLLLFCRRLGNIGSGLVFRLLPLVAVMFLVFGIQPPASPVALLASLVSVFFALVISSLLMYAFGIASFWFMSAHHFYWMLLTATRLLTGKFIPLWFYPDGLRTVAEWLPFQLVHFAPVSIYLGKTGPEQFPLLALQTLGWTSVLTLATWILWRKATRRIIVNGG